MLITFSISMYIMCVISCLFSALSHRVGALQISIIIIKNGPKSPSVQGHSTHNATCCRTSDQVLYHELFLQELLDALMLGGHEDLVHVVAHDVGVAAQPLLAVQDGERLVVRCLLRHPVRLVQTAVVRRS